MRDLMPGRVEVPLSDADDEQPSSSDLFVEVLRCLEVVLVTSCNQLELTEVETNKTKPTKCLSCVCPQMQQFDVTNP